MDVRLLDTGVSLSPQNGLKFQVQESIHFRYYWNFWADFQVPCCRFRGLQSPVVTKACNWQIQKTPHWANNPVAADHQSSGHTWTGTEVRSRYFVGCLFPLVHVVAQAKQQVVNFVQIKHQRQEEHVFALDLKRQNKWLTSSSQRSAEIPNGHWNQNCQMPKWLSGFLFDIPHFSHFSVTSCLSTSWWNATFGRQAPVLQSLQEPCTWDFLGPCKYIQVFPKIVLSQNGWWK